MIPAGYMAKRINKRPDSLSAPNVDDIFSVSGCISERFTDYICYWKHNGFCFFDSSEIIVSLATENSIVLEGTLLFIMKFMRWNLMGKIGILFSLTHQY